MNHPPPGNPPPVSVMLAQVSGIVQSANALSMMGVGHPLELTIVAARALLERIANAPMPQDATPEVLQLRQAGRNALDALVAELQAAVVLAPAATRINGKTIASG